MLSDEDFANILLTDERKVARNVFIRDDGSLVIGKTSSKFINKLLGAEVVISTNDVCLRLINTITGKGGTRNKEAFKGLSEDFMNALDRGDYNYAISRIFIAYRLDYNRDLETKIVSDDSTAETTAEEKFQAADGVVIRDGFGMCYAIKLKH